MFRQLKVWFCAALLVATVKPAFGFALLGPLSAPPDSAWQTEAIGYQEVTTDPYGEEDIGTPRNIGEGYRWNTPVLYWTVDQNFIKYFGTNGQAEIQKAFNIINSATTNSLSSYSANLTEFPVDSRRENPTASALNLVDLKSVALEDVIEELGLAEPVRWIWCLHSRVEGGTCPAGVSYAVIQRNWDISTFVPSAYVNGSLYTYRIGETCGTTPVTADAYEIPTDPFSANSAVADRGRRLGEYFTGLTRDDVAGLRYLMGTNDIVWENVDPSALLLSNTNEIGGGGIPSGTSLETLSTSNLTTLIQFARTNNGVAVSNAFPGIIITSSQFVGFQPVITTNFFFFFVNDPDAPIGSPEELEEGETITTNGFMEAYATTYGNVITNSYSPTSAVTVTETNVTTSPDGGVGSPLQTNVTTHTTYQPPPSGDFYLLPNPNCGFEVLSNLQTTVIKTSTTTVATNASPSGNLDGQSQTETVTTYFTNHLLAVLVTQCAGTNSTGGGTVTNSVGPAYREGVDHMQFVGVSFGNYDQGTGQFFQSFTNFYSVTMISNGLPVVQTFERVISRPDILFTADDLDSGAGPNVHFLNTRSIPNFVKDPVNGQSGLEAGPGIIQTSPITITFNDVGPVFTNSAPFLMDELSQVELRNLGSYDGTTNPPTVYPTGTSLQSYEGELLTSITPGSLTNGVVGIAYPSTQISGTGGQPPYTFSVAPGSAGLPPGLTFTNGLISGTPTNEGVYDFTVQMTDANLRTVYMDYTIPVYYEQILPTALPNGTVGVAYPSTTLGGIGGKPPYTFSLAADSAELPPGLGLTNGVVSGLPSTNGMYEFSLQISDSTRTAVEFGYGITITNAP